MPNMAAHGVDRDDNPSFNDEICTNISDETRKSVSMFVKYIKLRMTLV
jgi:hypothetical protein